MPAYCADPTDEVGPLLRDLDRAVSSIEFINPIRLSEDRAIVKRALEALTIVQRRIGELHPAEAAE